MWLWYFTRDVENDVSRVRKLRIAAEKEGNVLAGDDVQIFEEKRVRGELKDLKLDSV